MQKPYFYALYCGLLTKRNLFHRILSITLKGDAMILVNIESLSLSELRSIAEQEGIENSGTLPREELISLLEEKYEEEEKKIISVHISQVGAMNCIMIENYFEGELNFRNGQLVTSKEDTAYHGFGVRSIQMLAKKYKGDMRISHTNHTFSLQIMLPS